MRISDWSSDVCSSDLYYDEELRDLGRKHSAILSALQIFTDEQTADHNLVVFIGSERIEQVAFTRASKNGAGDGPKPPRPDYSQKVLDQLGCVRTMAVREAIVTAAELALDAQLTGLLGQVRGEVYSLQQDVEIKAEKKDRKS